MGVEGARIGTESRSHGVISLAERYRRQDDSQSFSCGVPKKMSRALVSAVPSALWDGVTSISGIDAN